MKVKINNDIFEIVKYRETIKYNVDDKGRRLPTYSFTIDMDKDLYPLTTIDTCIRNGIFLIEIFDDDENLVLSTDTYTEPVMLSTILEPYTNEYYNRLVILDKIRTH